MSDISVKEVVADVRAAIEELRAAGSIETVGVVTRVGDGVVSIYGLPQCGYN